MTEPAMTPGEAALELPEAELSEGAGVGVGGGGGGGVGEGAGSAEELSTTCIRVNFDALTTTQK